MKHNTLKVLVALSAMTGPAIASDSEFLVQLREDAQSAVAESCPVESQKDFDWDRYNDLLEEELLLIDIIERVQNNTEGFCTPPDVSKMAAKVSVIRM